MQRQIGQKEGGGGQEGEGKRKNSDRLRLREDLSKHAAVQERLQPGGHLGTSTKKTKTDERKKKPEINAAVYMGRSLGRKKKFHSKRRGKNEVVARTKIASRE